MITALALLYMARAGYFVALVDQSAFFIYIFQHKEPFALFLLVFRPAFRVNSFPHSAYTVQILFAISFQLYWLFLPFTPDHIS